MLEGELGLPPVRTYFALTLISKYSITLDFFDTFTRPVPTYVDKGVMELFRGARDVRQLEDGLFRKNEEWGRSRSMYHARRLVATSEL